MQINHRNNEADQKLLKDTADLLARWSAKFAKWSEHIPTIEESGGLQFADLSARSQAKVSDSIVCRQCGRQLNSTTNKMDWHIGLVNLMRFNSGKGTTTDMASHPYLTDGSYCFCNNTCLREWVLKNM